MFNKLRKRLLSIKIKNPLNKLSGKIAMKKNVIFQSHFKYNTNYTLKKTSMVRKFLSIVEIQKSYDKTFLDSFMFEINWSNKYSESCGPGLASGWYCTENAFLSFKRIPATV